MADWFRKNWKGLMAWCFALLPVCFATVILPRMTQARSDRSPEIVILGDSIFAQHLDGESIAEMLSKKLGREICDASLGGTSMARIDGRRYMDHTMDLLSMAALSKAVCSEDFAPQQQVNIRFAATEYFGEVIDQLDRTDFDGVRTLIIGYGVNDYQNGIPLENPEDLLDEYTYGGALRVALSAVTERFPQMRIIVVTPVYTWYPEKGLSCGEYDAGGGVLEAYVQETGKIAGQYGVELIDIYHDVYGINPKDPEDWKRFTHDGVHPNEEARRRISDKIADYLEEHL